MKKIIFVTGLANGGKTTTLKELIKKFGRQRLRANIYINNTTYHVRDCSNCDMGWENYQKRVRSLSQSKNLIYPLCLELGNKQDNDATIIEVINFLKSLEQTHELHFFVLANGTDNRKINQNYLDDLQSNYVNLKIFDPSQANMSNQLLEYLQTMTKGLNEL